MTRQNDIFHRDMLDIIISTAEHKGYGQVEIDGKFIPGMMDTPNVTIVGWTETSNWSPWSPMSVGESNGDQWMLWLEREGKISIASMGAHIGTFWKYPRDEGSLTNYRLGDSIIADICSKRGYNYDADQQLITLNRTGKCVSLKVLMKTSPCLTSGHMPGYVYHQWKLKMIRWGLLSTAIISFVAGLMLWA